MSRFFDTTGTPGGTSIVEWNKFWSFRSLCGYYLRKYGISVYLVIRCFLFPTTKSLTKWCLKTIFTKIRNELPHFYKVIFFHESSLQSWSSGAKWSCQVGFFVWCWCGQLLVPPLLGAPAKAVLTSLHHNSLCINHAYCTVISKRSN